MAAWSPCRRDVSGWLIVPRQGKVLLVEVRGICRLGVEVVVGEAAEPGLITALSLHDLGRGFTFTSLVRVVAARDRGDGTWALHAAFRYPLCRQTLAGPGSCP